MTDNINFVYKIKKLKNENIFQILFLGILFLYFFLKINLTLNKLVILIIISIIIKIIVDSKYNDIELDTEHQDKMIEKMDIIKYRYIFMNIEILNIYYQLNEYKYYNSTAFNDSLYNINKFLKSYHQMQENKMGDGSRYISYELIYQKIQNLILYQQKSLNSLMSIIINLPTGSVKKLNISSEFLENKTKELLLVTNKKIYEIVELYNIRWGKENIMSSVDFVNDLKPKSNPLNSYGYMANYDLY